MSHSGEPANIPQFKTFSELLRGNVVFPSADMHRLAMETVRITKQPRAKADIALYGIANRVAGFYCKGEPSQGQREVTLRASAVGASIGRVLLAAQHHGNVPIELQATPDQARLIPDNIEAIYESFHDPATDFAVKTVVHGLTLQNSKHIDLARLATGLQIYGYEQYSQEHLFGRIVDMQLSEMIDLKFPDES